VSFFKSLARLFTGRTPGSNLYSLAVQCNRCGEVIRAQINLNNDLSVEYDDKGNITSYFCRKVVIGKLRCYQPIEVALTFDANRKLVERKVKDGKLVED
jgi:hypothetical protein